VQEVAERMQGTGLPDGLFSNQNSQFGKNFQGFGLESLDIFMAIWNI
jgi:hypothetical protein